MPPILVPSSANVSQHKCQTEELNGRKDFILRGFVCDIIRPSKELLIQSNLLKQKKELPVQSNLLKQQGTTCSNKELPVQSNLLQQKNKVWKLFRIKNEDNGIAPVSLLLTVNMFQTCSNCWLWTGKCLPGSYHSHQKGKDTLETPAVVQNFNDKLEFPPLVFNYMQGFSQTFCWRTRNTWIRMTLMLF